jgi:hypothetical protein
MVDAMCHAMTCGRLNTTIRPEVQTTVVQLILDTIWVSPGKETIPPSYPIHKLIYN